MSATSSALPFVVPYSPWNEERRVVAERRLVFEGYASDLQDSIQIPRHLSAACGAPEAVWFLIVTAEQAMLTILAVNCEGELDQRHREELLATCDNLRLSEAPGDTKPVWSTASSTPFCVTPAALQQLRGSVQSGRASSRLHAQLAWKLSMMGEEVIATALSDEPYRRDGGENGTLLFVTDVEPQQRISVHSHRGRPTEVLRAEIEAAQVAGRVISPHLHAAQQLQEAAGQHKERYHDAAAARRQHNTGSRQKHAAWREARLALQVHAAARAATEGEHLAWVARDEQLRVAMDGAARDYITACNAWLQYVGSNGAHLPHSYSGPTIQVMCIIDDVRCVRLLGRTWVQGTIDEFTNLNEGHLPMFMLENRIPIAPVHMNDLNPVL